MDWLLASFQPFLQQVLEPVAQFALPLRIVRFPRVRVEVMDMPCLSNARGFLVIGEAAAAREHATAKR
jgi:hypothetical protein